MAKSRFKYDLHSGEVPAVIMYDKDLLEIFGSWMMSRVESEHNLQWWARIMVAKTILFLFVNYKTHNTTELRIRGHS